MKLAIAVSSLLLGACHVAPPPVMKPEPQPEPPKESPRQDVNRGRGELDGMELQWYTDGTLEEARCFERGAPAGTWRTWYSNGQLREQRKFTSQSEVCINSDTQHASKSAP